MEDNIEIHRFLLAYVVILCIAFCMRLIGIKEDKNLIISSIRMSLQLIIVGYLLTYIFSAKCVIYTLIYIFCMFLFTILRILNKNSSINRNFKFYIVLSVIFTGIIMPMFFVGVIINKSILDPRYIIPIEGMILGNMLNGISIALRTFQNVLKDKKDEIDVLLNLGVEPKEILYPYVKESLQTALIPTLNSMAGMGIVFLPGLMTGQLLVGIIPTTAILYQISMVLIMCSSVYISCFISILFGYKSYWNNDKQIINI